MRHFNDCALIRDSSVPILERLSDIYFLISTDGNAIAGGSFY